MTLELYAKRNGKQNIESFEYKRRRHLAGRSESDFYYCKTPPSIGNVENVGTNRATNVNNEKKIL